MQAVLSATSVYIPTPASNGLVENYQALYPPDRWHDTTTYIVSSNTVDVACDAGLANGFTYYMDERDAEWLHRHNEIARGEGTSSQPFISSTSLRASGRSAKAKGKQPEINEHVPISLDEFELVMGIFEKLTHDKPEYLTRVSLLVHFMYMCGLIHCRAFKLAKSLLHSRNTKIHFPILSIKSYLQRLAIPHGFLLLFACPILPLLFIPTGSAGILKEGGTALYRPSM